MKRPLFAPDSYYHIFNRSNDERSIFLEDRDYIRFLFFVLFYQAPLSFYNIGRQTSHFVKHSMFNMPEETIEKIVANKRVELNAFAIMPNHFHLFAQEKEKGGVSWYLQRVQNGYAKYFNTKYKKRGHLFQGRFQAVSITTDEQLLYLSAYIHRNPRDIRKWRGKESNYPWSSYQDCVKKNRWGKLLNTSVFLNQFSTTSSYEQFVETSTAKLKPGESPSVSSFLE